MTKFIKTLLSLPLAMAVIFVSLCQATFAQTATISGGTTFQTIDGFGAATHRYVTSLTTSQAALLFSPNPGTGIGLSLIRGDIPVDGSCNSVGASCAGTSQVYWPDIQKATSYGAKFWAASWSPPVGMNSNGNVSTCNSPGTNTLTNYSGYATYLTNYVKSVQNQGISVYGISPQNEPDICVGYDGAIWSGQNIHDFIKNNLYPTMASAGLTGVKIVMPESGHYSGLTSLANITMADPTAAAEVGVVAFHGYDNPSNPTNPYSSSSAHYWETEMSAAPGYGPSLCGGCWDPSMANAILWATILHNELVNGKVSAWHYWLLNNYGNDDQGFITTTAPGVIPKRLYAIGNWSLFVRPGWVMIGSTNTPQGGVYVSAFKDPSTGSFAVVSVNTNSGSVSQPFVLSGLTATTVTPYVTDASNNLAAKTAVTVSGSAFSYTLSGTSVTTFVSNGSTGGSTITGVTVSCSPASITTSQTSTCTPTVSGTGSYSSSVTWSVNGGTINSSGLYTPSAAGSFTVVATSLQDNTKTGSATVQVTTGGSTTANASSCQQAAVLAALNTVTSTTKIVTIPAGTCDWTGTLSWTQPVGNTDLTIQGTTAVNCTGSGGTVGYSCSSSDSTIIRDSLTGTFSSPFSITASGVNSKLRITGLTIQGGSGQVKNDGILVVYGPTHNLRIDHNHFNVSAYTTSFSTFTGRLYGDITGVLDHNIYTNGTASTLSQGFALSNNINDTIGFGDGTWANPTGFGSLNFIFIEDSIFYWGEAEDCDTGGKFVFRHNNVYYGSAGSAPIHAHGTKTQAGRGRGCRAYEAYLNYIIGPPSGSYDAAFGSAGGPSLVWGNTLDSHYNWFAAISTTRSDGSAAETNTPSGWGYCGTTINSNGVGSAWDGNSNAGTGYPCMDGIGRGQGQALNGLNFSNAKNSVTNSISWPHQYLEPTYYWMNTTGVAADLRINSGDGATQLDRDVYLDSGSVTSPVGSCVGSFTGSCGTGFGPRSARPSACTAGPGGTYGTSPIGSEGVGYWSTDLATLSVCTSTGSPGTWTDIYQPAAYPHPLTGGVTQTATPIITPSGGSFTSTQSVSITDGTSGAVIHYTVDGTVPTAASPTYTSSLQISSNVIVEAIAIASGSSSSAASATFTFTQPQCADPQQLPPNFSSNTYVSAPVTIGWTESTAGCTIYFTLDGSTPTLSSAVYTNPLSITVTTTMSVIAAGTGFSPSPTRSGTWTLPPAQPTPFGQVFGKGTAVRGSVFN